MLPRPLRWCSRQVWVSAVQIQATGSGTTQTFAFTFTGSDIAVVDVLINNYLDGENACYFALTPASATSGYLYLVNDAGDGGYVSGTPMFLPSTGSLQNNQCVINGSGSSVMSNGLTLTVTLSVTFKTGFAGNKIFYMAARSNTQNSGWQAMGTWNVPGPAGNGPSVGGHVSGKSGFRLRDLHIHVQRYERVFRLRCRGYSHQQFSGRY